MGVVMAAGFSRGGFPRQAAAVPPDACPTQECEAMPQHCYRIVPNLRMLQEPAMTRRQIETALCLLGAGAVAT
ncbi:MAG: hypothetical protein WBG88_03985, partial [Mesorhizobium sp.]